MTTEKFSEKIISKIENEQMKPKPRWGFVFKDYFLWTIGFLSLLFGALSFSLIIYLFSSSGENIFSNRFGASFWEIFLAAVPIFWLIFLALFNFLFYLNLRKTKKAYKHSSFFILIIGLVVSVALGTSFYMFGFSRQLDGLLGKNVSPEIYGRFMNPQLDFWSEPDKGRLSGVIAELENNESFYLVDKNSKKWLVDHKHISLPHVLRVEKGLVIRSFGKKTTNNQFQATTIMPMHSADNFFDRPPIKEHINDPFIRPGIKPQGEKPRR